MKKMKIVLDFPTDTVEEPITYHLIAKCGVQVNILRASIDPGKQGRMVVELAGNESRVADALNYLENKKVKVSSLATEIRHSPEKCTGCTACLPHCPTGALDVDRRSWEVHFEPEKCIVCFSCLDACVYHAMNTADA